MKLTRKKLNPSILGLLKGKTNHWKGTVFETWSSLTNKSKGRVGEEILKQFFEDRGYPVSSRINTDHDFVVAGTKIEVKFSLATNSEGLNLPVFNHISLDKDWDSIFFIYVDVKTLELKGIFMFKDAVRRSIKMFSKQQGGKKQNNDDYMLSGVENLEKLKDRKYAQCILFIERGRNSRSKKSKKKG